MAALLGLASCNKFLDRPPLSDVSPDYYLRSEADLAAYTVGAYNFPSHSGFNVGTYGNDNNTDNQANSTGSNIWVPGQYRVPQSGGSWNFSRIRNLNYFMEQVLPRWQAKSLQGNTDNISHYIGEAYFLRAYEYFSKLQAFGDFPIVRNSLRDDMESLRAASRRRPRNEVARYIIMNLDSAITLLKDAPPNGKNRISKTAAQLFKSRVALFEASWLTYHKGTAQVPGGPGWPRAGRGWRWPRCPRMRAGGSSTGGSSSSTGRRRASRAGSRSTRCRPRGCGRSSCGRRRGRCRRSATGCGWSRAATSGPRPAG